MTATVSQILVLIVALACSCSAPSLWLEPVPWQHNGAPVVYEARELPDGAHAGAQIRGGLGWIYWDPDTWGDLSPTIQSWVLAHERGHLDGSDEVDADCWALHWMGRSDRLTSAALSEIVGAVYEWDGDADHPDGELRALMMMVCAEEGGL